MKIRFELGWMSAVNDTLLFSVIMNTKLELEVNGFGNHSGK